MQHPFIPAAYIWAAFVVLISALLIYLTTRSWRERKRNKRPLPTGAETMAPTRAELDAKNNELAAKLQYAEASRDEYFKTSVAWSDLMQKHFGTRVLGDADKAIRSMLEMEAKHNDELKRANERADHNRREMVQQSATATALRQERDKAQQESARLEAELDRGNETITWMKADLNTAYAIIKEQEAVLASLGIKEPRRRDEKGRFAPNTKGGHLRKLIGGDSVVLKAPVFNADSGVQIGEVEVQSTEGERPDDSHAGEQAQPSELPPERDWNVPQAFPEGYVVPKRTRIVVVKDIHEYIKAGTKGITTDGHFMPDCEFENGIKDHTMYSHELAPVDPRQHPEHPEFKPAEQPTAEFSGKPFYTDAQLKEIEEVNNSTKPAEQPALERLNETVEKYKEAGVMFMPESEPPQDHPCLKRCIAPLGGHCKCPASAPRLGTVRFTHDRDFFIGKGLLKPSMTEDDHNILRKWAEENGLEYFGRTYCSVAGLNDNQFAFSRPAVNSDFDIPQSNS